jgi:site-specific DNA-cytosine methylase
MTETKNNQVDDLEIFLDVASRKNPVDYAKSRGLATDMNLPFEVVERNQAQVARDQEKKLNLQLLGKAPGTAEYMRRNPAAVPAVSDMVEEMGRFERTLRSIPNAFGSGIAQRNIRQLQASEMRGTATPGDLGRLRYLTEQESERPDFDLEPIAALSEGRFLDVAASTVPLTIEESIDIFDEMRYRLGFGAGGAVAGGIVGATGMNPVTVGGGAIAGFVSAQNLGGFVAMREQQIGPMYDYYKNLPDVEHGEARALAEVGATFSGLINMVPAAALARRMPVVGGLLGRLSTDALQQVLARRSFRTATRHIMGAYVEGFALEAVSESFDQLNEFVWQGAGNLLHGRDVFANMEVDVPPATPGGKPTTLYGIEAIVAKMMMGGVQGGIAGGGTHGAAEFSSATIDLVRQDTSDHRLRIAATAINQAGKSELRQRDPKTYREHVASLVEQGVLEENVEVSAEAMREFFQDASEEEVEAAWTSIEALQRDDGVAYETGADFQVPVADFLTYLTGSEQTNDLAQHVRWNAKDFTSAEMQDMEDSGELASRLVASVAENMENLTAEDEVLEAFRESSLEQLRKVHPAGIAEQLADYATAVQAVRANRLNKPLLEMLSREATLEIVPPGDPRDQPYDGPTLEQRLERRRLSRVLRDMKAGRNRVAESAPLRPILSFLRDLGGIEPDSPLAGDLLSMGLTSRGKGSFPGLFREGGTADLSEIDLAEHPWLSSYFEEDTLTEPDTAEPGVLESRRGSADALMAAIDAELRGSPLVPPELSNQIGDMEQERGGLLQAIEAAGMSLEDSSVEELLDAVTAADDAPAGEGMAAPGETFYEGALLPPGLKSVLLEVATTLPKKGTAAEYRAALEKQAQKGNIKNDELQFSGLLEFLEMSEGLQDPMLDPWQVTEGTGKKAGRIRKVIKGTDPKTGEKLELILQYDKDGKIAYVEYRTPGDNAESIRIDPGKVLVEPGNNMGPNRSFEITDDPNLILERIDPEEIFLPDAREDSTVSRRDIVEFLQEGGLQVRVNLLGGEATEATIVSSRAATDIFEQIEDNVVSGSHSVSSGMQLYIFDGLQREDLPQSPLFDDASNMYESSIDYNQAIDEDVWAGSPGVDAADIQATLTRLLSASNLNQSRSSGVAEPFRSRFVAEHPNGRKYIDPGMAQDPDELLILMLLSNTTFADEYFAALDAGPKSKTATQLEGSTEFGGYIREAGEGYMEILVTIPRREKKTREEFTSGHWGSEPSDVVVSLLAEPRDGKLFIFEIQSDWHQRGRKKGYLTAEAAKELDAARLKSADAMAVHNETRGRVKADIREKFLAAGLSAELDDQPATLAALEAAGGTIKVPLDDYGTNAVIVTMAERQGFNRPSVGFGAHIEFLNADGSPRGMGVEKLPFDFRHAHRAVHNTVNEITDRDPDVMAAKTLYGNANDEVAKLHGKVPEAPFSKTESWTDLGLKNALLQAHAMGLSGVVMTDAQMIDDRWGDEEVTKYYATKVPKRMEKLAKKYGGEIDLRIEEWDGIGAQGAINFTPELIDAIESDSIELFQAIATDFAGIGTVDAMLPQHPSVHAAEIQPDIVTAYNEAHGTNYRARDVLQVDPRELEDADLYHASPVCTNLSAARKGRGVSELDEASARKVAGNILAARPPAVTIENVPLYADTVLLKIITDVLDEEGYTYDVDTYDAADYGAAQTRKRMILRAVREGELPPLPATSEPGDWFSVVSDLIDGAEDSTIPNWERTRIDVMIDRGELDASLPIITMGGSTDKRRASARNAGGPSPTLTATPKSVPRILMPDGKVKKVSPRMMARLMGLPDDFVIPEDKWALSKTVMGNGVHGAVTTQIIGPVADLGEQIAQRGQMELFQSGADPVPVSLDPVKTSLSADTADSVSAQQIAEHNARVELLELMQSWGDLPTEAVNELLEGRASYKYPMFSEVMERNGDLRTFEEVVESHEGEDSLDEWQGPTDALEWAKLSMGTTDDLAEAGYILPDGTLLDFSGRRDGGDAGQRSMDHRQIDLPVSGVSGSDLMMNFMGAGAIRIDSNSGLIDVVVTPTREQFEQIQQLADLNDGAYVDLNQGERSGFEVVGAENVVASIRRGRPQGTFGNEFFQPVASEKVAATPGIQNVLKYLNPDEARKLKANTAQRLIDLIDELPEPGELASVAFAGRAKRGWYLDSAKAILDVFGLEDARRFTGLLAATSPQTSVESNLVNTLAVWNAWVRAGRPVDKAQILAVMGEAVQGAKGEDSVLDAWRNNSFRILTAENPTRVILSGPKVNSFMLNLRGVVDEVTNDTWMANIMGVQQAMFKGRKTKTEPGKSPGYMAANVVTRRAAEILSKRTGLDWTPAEIQETIWSWARTLGQLGEAKGETRSFVRILTDGELTDERIADTPDFAILFSQGVYRTLLKEGGYEEELQGLERAARDNRPDGAGARGEAGQAPGVTEGRYRRDLRRAARRLERTRKERRARKAELGQPDEFEQPDDDLVVGESARGSIQLTRDLTLKRINWSSKADLTTFLHENGHLYLEMLQSDALVEGGDESLRLDLETLRRELGVAEGARIEGEAHEKFARLLELYIMEGHAPSLEMAVMFQRFSRWLVDVYTQLKRRAYFGDLQLTDEVRGVLDRMHATQTQIDSAREQRGLDVALFDTDVQAAMDADEWRKYKEALDGSRRHSQHSFHKRVISRIKRELSEEWKAKRSRIQDEVETEIQEDPLWKARAWLQRGEMPGERPESLPADRDGIKLDRDDLVKLFGKEILKELAFGRYGVWSKDGMAVELVVAHFGLESEDQLVRFLADSRKQSLKKEVKERTDRLMAERHGELDTSDELEEATVEALASDPALKALILEEQALTRQAGGRPRPATIMRQQIAAMVGQMQFLNLQPERFRKAAAKASRAAVAAIAEGDAEAAREAKQRQIASVMMERAQRLAIKKSEQHRKSLAEIAKPSNATHRKVAKAGYWDQVASLLEGIELKASVSRTEIGKRESLATWIAAREAEDGSTDSIPDWLRERANLKSWKQLTVDELQGVRDAIDNIVALARLKVDLKTRGEARDLAAVAEELAEAAKQNVKARTPKTPPGTKPSGVAGRLDRASTTLFSAEAQLLKIENVLDRLDGFMGDGPWRTYIWKPLKDAREERARRWDDFSVRYGELVDQLSKGREKELLENKHFKELEREGPNGTDGNYNKWGLIMMALNLGNTSNATKLLGGYGWNEQVLLSIMSEQLTDRDLDFVEGVWELVNELWPDIRDQQIRLEGVAPPKIEGREVQIGTRKLRGQYFPVVYDLSRSDRVERLGELDAIFTKAQNQVLKPTTGHGHTKSRVKVEYPIKLETSVIASHMDQVILDLTHRETLLQVDRLLQSPVVRSAVEETIGAPVYKLFRPFLQRIAADAPTESSSVQGIDRVLRKFRVNATTMALALRATTLAMQASGNFNGIAFLRDRVGAGWSRHYFSALKESSLSLIGQRRAALVQNVFEQSDFMRGRIDSIDRDMRAVQKNAEAALPGERYFKAENEARAKAMGLIGAVQLYTVDIPVWNAAYNAGLLEMGLEHEAAVDFADQAVSMTQGSGGVIDQSQLQSAGEAYKMLTTFFSYHNTLYQRLRETGVRAIERKEYMRLLSETLLVLVLPFVWAQLARAAIREMTDGDGEEYLPEELSDIPMWLLAGTVSEGLGTIPVVREGSGLIGKWLSDGHYFESRVPFQRFIADIQDLSIPRSAVELSADLARMLLGWGRGLPIDQPVDLLEKAFED